VDERFKKLNKRSRKIKELNKRFQTDSTKKTKRFQTEYCGLFSLNKKIFFLAKEKKKDYSFKEKKRRIIFFFFLQKIIRF